MSPVRRTFCLLLLFDFLATVILWIIYTKVRKCRHHTTDRKVLCSCGSVTFFCQSRLAVYRGFFRSLLQQKTIKKSFFFFVRFCVRKRLNVILRNKIYITSAHKMTFSIFDLFLFGKLRQRLEFHENTGSELCFPNADVTKTVFSYRA